MARKTGVLLHLFGAVVLTAVVCPAQVDAQTASLVGMGDSIGEGVQSAIASERTQNHTYLDLIALQMGVSYAPPLMSTSYNSVIGSVAGRARLDPSLLSPALAVSGADSTSILTEIAGTPFATETDLVLSPRTGYTQMSAAESIRAPFNICYIGNNDVLGAVLNFDQYNPSQIAAAITPQATFQANYDQINSRLSALGGKVAYATIVDVTQIGFLFSPQDLVAFLGSSYGLPQGSYTSVVAMLLIKMGIIDGNLLLRNPNWVMDPSEVQTIQNAVNGFNQSIAAHGAQIGAAVVDIHGIYNSYMQNPPVIGGVTLTNRYLGGVFSLDGVHPSDIGHALMANAFIQAMDTTFGMNIPVLTSSQLVAILDADPFVDFQGVLQVRGRPLNGIVETLGPRVGISGNFSNVPGSVRVQPNPGIDPAAGVEFMRQYFIATGRDPNTKWDQSDAIAAMRRLFASEIKSKSM